MKGVNWDGWIETFGRPVYDGDGETIALLCDSNNDQATDLRNLIEILEDELKRKEEDGNA